MNFRYYVLLEVSVERAEKIITGIAQDVKTIGIMTPTNPQAKKFSPKENALFISQFIDYLRERDYEPISVGGKFAGNEEQSFLIKNIGKKELINLGRMYDQQSVIWGSRETDTHEKGVPHFHFEYIEGGRTVSTSHKIFRGPKVHSQDDNYSTIKGKKFVIPFFQGSD